MPDSASSLPRSWSRVTVASVHPSIDGGHWPIKRSVGETVTVTAGVLVDGHETLAVELVSSHANSDDQDATQMRDEGNDEYSARFSVDKLGRYHYWVRAWINQFATWQEQFRRRVEGGEPTSEITSELQVGISLLDDALEQAPQGTEDRQLLEAHREAFQEGNEQVALGDEIATLVRRHAPH